jgi:hypothetical protein
MSNRPRRKSPVALALPLTMIVSAVVVSGCGNDKLSDDAYGFIDLAPYYYDGSSAANPSAGLPREIAPTKGWLNGVRTEFYDFGLVGVTKKRTDTKLPDYASVPPMYFFYDSGGNPLFSKPVYEQRTGLWHMRGGADVLDPNPIKNAPKKVPYSVRTRAVLGSFQRPIVDRLQHNTDYSGLWEIWEVTAPDGYQPDAIKNFATLQKGIDGGSFSVRRTKKVINCPVLDDRQYVVPSPMYYGVPHPRIEIWYRTKQGSCFLADGMLTLGAVDQATSNVTLYKAGPTSDSKRLQTFDVISYTIGSGESARTTITAPVSKLFIPTAKVATLDSRGTVDVRYTGDNVADGTLPRLTPADPPGYRPIRWMWDLNVPQDPPYVPATYKSTAQMDPVQMVNRLTANAPFTKNYPIVGVNRPCTADALINLQGMPEPFTLRDGSQAATCADLPHAPNVPLTCVTFSVINTVTGALVPEAGGSRCDIPLARFGEFCAPAIAGCTNFDPKRSTTPAMAGGPTPPPLNPDELAAKDLNDNNSGSILGGYTCQPNTSQGGYCYLRCDVDGSAGSKTANTVDITYKGPDGQVKKDKADLPYDARCGNIPGYKCLNPAGTIPNQLRVCLRQCDTGKPDTFNDEFCKYDPGIFGSDGKTQTPTTLNERVTGVNFQKGMTCSTRGLNGSAGCQWDPAYEPRDTQLNFVP